MVLEEHRAEAEYVRPDLRNYSHIVHVFSGVPVRHQWRVDGHVRRYHSVEGSALILPDGFEAAVHCRRSGAGMQWILALDPIVLNRRLEELLDGKRAELVPHFDVVDSQLQRLIQALHADISAGSPAGSLFGESIGAALALHLARHYSTRSAFPNPPAQGLPARPLSRVLDYIHSNLTADLHLTELANVAGLSTFHFAKLFKQSTGASPHQYVMQRRLERAKELLRNPSINLSEVSLRAGFADHSHLSNVFRRFIGMTPSRYRAQR
jgi:AraC family transcriptional regulator